MSEKRRALGRGLGALIPNSPSTGASRPVDVFFRDSPSAGSVGVKEREDLDADRSTAEVGPGRAGDKMGTPPAAEDHAADLDGHRTSHPADTDRTEDPAGDESELRPVPGAAFAEIPLDAIRPNPRQPRTTFDEEDMAELVHSIREIGVLQPIVVRSIDDGLDGVEYELIVGERRWRASREAGTDTVPAIIKDTRDDALLRDALLENLHRSELNPLEEAAAYQQLLEDFGCTQEELAGRIGRSRPQISNTLRLLRLPPLVARRVAAGVISAGHARALLTLSDGAAMERLAQRIVAEGLSVRSVEEIVAVGDGSKDASPNRKPPRAGTRRPQMDDLAARLADHFDTSAKISLGQRKGRLSIEFASVDDLNRILDQMGVDRSGL
jgi:ParB family chromosome partitioning protein